MQLTLTWGMILVMSFLIATLKVMLSMMLSNGLGPEGKENPAALMHGGMPEFWHLLHTNSEAMNASILYDTLVTTMCLSIMKYLSGNRSLI